jgi:hypothetical protein
VNRSFRGAVDQSRHEKRPAIDLLPNQLQQLCVRSPRDPQFSLAKHVIPKPLPILPQWAQRRDGAPLQWEKISGLGLRLFSWVSKTPLAFCWDWGVRHEVSFGKF